jgi:4-hydroxy-tetrahydrodipicolinate reductase
MNIALIGYGKMGKAVEEIALKRGHSIVSIVNSETTINEADFSIVDVAIEFTKPILALDHIDFCIQKNIPLVIGTTGWNEKLVDVTRDVLLQNGSLLHASNFSIGVNIFFEVNKQLAKLMSGHTNYTVSIEEIHHTEKLDSPSGTAISIANGILENNSDYMSWVLGEGVAPHTAEGQFGVTSLREPHVPGTHTVQYHSDIDTIKISHEAHNRKGFALGAVIAAEWLMDKKGIFTMNDILKMND